MSQTNLHGVAIRALHQVEDERGTLQHMLRASDPGFERFGEIYFSGVHEGAVKAWRRHTRITSNLAVPVGAVRLVLHDTRAGSPTEGRTMIVETGVRHYGLITIPPGIWTGWLGLGPGLSLVANCATEPHDPAEVERADPHSDTVPYRWPA